MDALKVYDVKKICDARLCIVDMATAFVRALATVLMMGGVAVLYRYRAVLAALFCTRGRRPARSPPTPRAFGSARRLEARPGPATRPRAPQPPACRRSALPPPSSTAAARMSKGRPAAALGHRSRPHVEGVPCRRPRVPQPPACRRGALPPPSGTAAARMSKGRPATRPSLVPALAPVLAVGLAMHIQNRRDQTVPAIHRRGGGI